MYSFTHLSFTFSCWGQSSSQLNNHSSYIVIFISHSIQSSQILKGGVLNQQQKTKIIIYSDQDERVCWLPPKTKTLPPDKFRLCCSNVHRKASTIIGKIIPPPVATQNGARRIDREARRIHQVFTNNGMFISTRTGRGKGRLWLTNTFCIASLSCTVVHRASRARTMTGEIIFHRLVGRKRAQEE